MALSALAVANMEAQELSSNWKKLQKSLEHEKAVSGKRKAPAHGESRELPNGHAAKRTKRTHRSSHIIRKSDQENAETSAPAHREGVETAAQKHPLASPPTAAPPPTLAPPLGPHTAGPPETPGCGLVPNTRPGRYVAMDCEMVGVGPDPAAESALARISLVDYHGALLYDAFVRPREAVTDYRTRVSGITPALVAAGGGARSLDVVQRDVADLLKGRVLVGHALSNDLRALFLSHPRRDIRDTGAHAPYRRMVGGRAPGLRRLAKELLGLEIQAGAHSSVEDARATMALFRREKAAFEREAVRKYGAPKRVEPKKTGETAEHVEARDVRRKRRKKLSD